MGGMTFDPTVIIQALVNVLQPSTLVLILCGVLGGIIVGIIPGLGTTMAIALLIPFTFIMQPEVGISLLIAVYVGGISGGCVTAILIRMPGTPAAVATIMDGFPMARRGLAGQAIGNAIVASFFGTIVSGIFLVLLAPMLARIALKFHFAEYVSVCIFALTAVISITGSTVSRGMVTGLLGLLCATFGLSEEDGLTRFDFGFVEMTGGFGLIPPLIGLFAVSQMMTEVVRDSDAATRFTAKIERVIPTIRDMSGNITNYVRSSLLGTFIGVVPALGATAAGLISYAQAKNASKEPHRFGTGIVEGVIASETANNATIGGALIIMLTLGIPGDGAGAILIGGLMIHGLEPGPQLFMNNPEVIYGIYFTVFFGSLLMITIMLGATKPLAKIVEVPKHLLLPSLFILAATGIFSLNNRVFDVVVMCVFGGIGYLFERFRYPLAPFILGIVLGPLIEGNFRKMLGQAGSVAPLFTKPIALIFLLLSVVSIAFSLYRRRKYGGMIPIFEE